MFTTLFPDRKLIFTLRLKQSMTEHTCCRLFAYCNSLQQQKHAWLVHKYTRKWFDSFFLTLSFFLFHLSWVYSSKKVAQKLSTLLWRDAFCWIYFIKRRQWGTSYTFWKILEICFSNLRCEHPTCLIWPKSNKNINQGGGLKKWNKGFL
jgi:hypothetical protein